MIVVASSEHPQRPMGFGNSFSTISSNVQSCDGTVWSTSALKKHKSCIDTPPTNIAVGDFLSPSVLSVTCDTRDTAIQCECPENCKLSLGFTTIDSPSPSTKDYTSSHCLNRQLYEAIEDETLREDIAVHSTRFQSAIEVLASPSLCAVFLDYLFVHNRAVAPTLFYLVAKQYAMVQMNSKELAKDYLRLFVEIYTSFLHKKSPLPVKFDSRLIQQMEVSILSKETTHIFEGCCNAVLPEIQIQLNKLNNDIRHGLDTWKPQDKIDLTINHHREQELCIFETVIGPRLTELQRYVAGVDAQQTNASRQIVVARADCSVVSTWIESTSSLTGVPRNQLALVIRQSLVSIYRYFAVSTHPSIIGETSSDYSDFGSSPTCPSTPAPLQHSLRKSLFTRSIGNLATSSNSTCLGNETLTGSICSNLSSFGTTNWDELLSYNSKLKSKLSNVIFGSWKSRHSTKGHTLHDVILHRIVECSICEGLLWGLAPQGLACQGCEITIHHRCKSSLKQFCRKDSKCSSSSLVSNSIVGRLSGLSLVPRPGVLTSHSLRSNPTLETVNVSIEKNIIPPKDDIYEENLASGLSVSNEDISRHRIDIRDKTLGDPLQFTTHSPYAALTLHESIVKRSNSSISQVYRKNHFRHGPGDGFTTPEPSLYCNRNEKQSIEDHSNSERDSAHSKHTDLLLQSPIMTNRGSKRSTGHQASSSSSSWTATNVPELLLSWEGDPEMEAFESFDAATELHIHFPEYEIPIKGPRVEDHIRTLVLLEFHQKVRYMVSYLKQFDYLLLQCWPMEHIRIADVMALDRIPRLIRLFRSLVQTIRRTLEPQGYGKMAEEVLSWITENNEANLKAWVRDCQALSCTNMLEAVKLKVREHGRKHSEMQRLFDIRSNKFVLIEELSQVRILYFNLPLICNNIVKDLEKKTTRYRDEAKIWKEIHAKLASIPHSIDTICMPLVHQINDGHFHSTMDKGEQLTRHQAQGGTVPFADLLLDFPCTIFQHWVIDYAEVVVDNLTLSKDSKFNYDYFKERTDCLAIILEFALVLLVKDGNRFILRPFKCSKNPGLETPSANVTPPSIAGAAPTAVISNILGNTTKLSPAFSTKSVFTSRVDVGNEYMLNMIFKEQAVLLRLSFSSKKTRERWLHILKEREEPPIQRQLSTEHGKRASLPLINKHFSPDKVSVATDVSVDSEQFVTEAGYEASTVQYSVGGEVIHSVWEMSPQLYLRPTPDTALQSSSEIMLENNPHQANTLDVHGLSNQVDLDDHDHDDDGDGDDEDDKQVSVGTFSQITANSNKHDPPTMGTKVGLSYEVIGEETQLVANISDFLGSELDDKPIDESINSDDQDTTEQVLMAVALQLVEDVFKALAEYQLEPNTLATSIAPVLTDIGGSKRRSHDFRCTTDSGISFNGLPGQLSSCEDDDLTVTGFDLRTQRPHRDYDEQGTSEAIIYSDHEKRHIARAPSPNSISVGRNDSQKSTTSSGYLGSEGEIIQQDWI